MEKDISLLQTQLTEEVQRHDLQLQAQRQKPLTAQDELDSAKPDSDLQDMSKHVKKKQTQVLQLRHNQKTKPKATLAVDRKGITFLQFDS